MYYDRGWTLIELITVLVMLSALAIVVAPRLINQADINALQFQQQLLNALRYAHKQAINSGCPIRVEVRVASNDYGVYLYNNATASSCGSAGFGANPLPDPAGGVFEGAAPAGVTLTGGVAFTFDGAGRPNPAGGTISFNGRSIVVANETGYVYAP